MNAEIELEELRELRDEMVEALDEYFDAKAAVHPTFAETVKRHQLARDAVRDKLAEIKYMREIERKRRKS